MNENLAAADRALLRANLMRISDITDRIGVRINMLAIWRNRYEGFPEPLVPPDMRGSGALYWWPDIEKFLRDNDLPDARHRKPGGRSPLPRKTMHETFRRQEATP